MLEADRLVSRSRLILVTIILAAAAPTRAAPFIAGADISSLLVHEDHGAVYRDGGQIGDAIAILADNGTNYFRLRQFVDPQFKNNYNGGTDPFVAQDVEYNIELASRVKQAGGKILLDFHYSDTWADPGHQWKPAAWESLSPSQLEQQVYDYTKQTIESFKSAGVLPDMVQIGNEIAGGLLWDDGRLCNRLTNHTGRDRLLAAFQRDQLRRAWGWAASQALGSSCVRSGSASWANVSTRSRT